MSRLIEKFETTAREWRLWEGENKGKFVTAEGKQGHFSKSSFDAAKAHRVNTNSVSVPNPKPGNDGNIYVDPIDAGKMGQAANLSSPNVEIEPDDQIRLPSIDSTFTAKEIEDAYNEMGQDINNDVIRYIGDN